MAEEYWESTPFGKDSYFAPGWDEKQKEERQNNNKSLKSTTHNSGKVYLTFDDGLQLGTRDVLDVLKENNVKATFFLTGIHVKSFIEKIDMDQGLDMLKEIYQKHLIGNHSYSHANDFYENYYKDGLKIGVKSNGSFIFRSVLEDFKLNDRTINKYLIKSGVNINPNYHHKYARFPGRNTWKTNAINDIKTDTKNETNDLFKFGYLLFGWDTEWNMIFQIVNKSKHNIQTKVDEDKMEWNNEKYTHPFWDLCSKDFVDDDRLNETWKGVSADIEDFAHHSRIQPFDDKSKTSKKVILLMHERAFRQCGSKYKDEASKLSLLIKSLRKKGFTFDTIDNY